MTLALQSQGEVQQIKSQRKFKRSRVTLSDNTDLRGRRWGATGSGATNGQSSSLMPPRWDSRARGDRTAGVKYFGFPSYRPTSTRFGHQLNAVPPHECSAYLRNAGYASVQCHHAQLLNCPRSSADRFGHAPVSLGHLDARMPIRRLSCIADLCQVVTP